MKTLGIDLSAQPKDTAACVAVWEDGVELTVEEKLDDDRLLDLITDADKVAIDAPFGWPDAFLDAIRAHAKMRAWPGRDQPVREYRRSLSYRATDEWIKEQTDLDPLSVSTDKLGVTAMRCALLLDRIASDGEPVDRSGAGRIIEVYPAAILKRWGLPWKGYKRAQGRDKLAGLVDQLDEQPEWLDMKIDGDRFRESDHAFDALICTLAARAAALGMTQGPPAHLLDQARREGWIQLPVDGSPESLSEG